jgi:hypothetical protein
MNPLVDREMRMRRKQPAKVLTAKLVVAVALMAAAAVPGIAGPGQVAKATAMLNCDIFMCGSNHSQVLL